MVEEVNVESVASLSEFWFKMIRAVKVSLNLEVRSFVYNPLPTAQQISSRQVCGAENVDLRRSRIKGICGRFACAFTVGITLEREAIATAWGPVCAETGLT